MRHSGVWYIILLMVIVIVSPARANDTDSDKRATAYFEAGDYKQALEIWNGLITSGKITAGIYYNTGLAYSRLDSTHLAMLSFEKALRLKPFNRNINEAVRQEKTKLENAVIPVKPFFLSVWVKGVLTLLRPGYWAALGLGLLLYAVFGFVRKQGNQNTISRFVSDKVWLFIIGFGIVCLLNAGLSYKALYRDDEAIIRETCAIRQAPSMESPIRLHLEPGEKVILLDQIGEWYNVRLLNLEEGWIRRDCFSLIIMGNP